MRGLSLALNTNVKAIMDKLRECDINTNDMLFRSGDCAVNPAGTLAQLQSLLRFVSGDTVASPTSCAGDDTKEPAHDSAPSDYHTGFVPDDGTALSSGEQSALEALGSAVKGYGDASKMATIVEVEQTLESRRRNV